MDIQCGMPRAVRVAAGRFAPGLLGELTPLVPFEMVDEALVATMHDPQVKALRQTDRRAHVPGRADAGGQPDLIFAPRGVPRRGYPD